jgi:hypothetical protein
MHMLVVVVLAVLVVIVLLLLVGLRAAPAPFQVPAVAAGAVERMPLPPGLPPPVARFYRTVYGDEIPMYLSAILTGRGTLAFAGVTMPARWRFVHDAERGYRHYIETTFYGFPVMRVNEHYLDGHARFVLPFGVQENDPNLDSAANLGLWAERIAYPAAFVTDPRVRWEPVDDTTARLHVPFGDAEQTMTVTFDPATDLLTRIEADRRFADAKRGYVRWWGTADEWAPLNGVITPVRQSVQWADQDSPWLHMVTEDVVLNADVSQYIEQSGP